VTLRPEGTPADLAGKFRGAVHTVRLGPLDSRDITTIVREALRGRGSLGADRVRRITELAGGNPLFALELLRNALAGGGDAGRRRLRIRFSSGWRGSTRRRANSSRSLRRSAASSPVSSRRFKRPPRR